MLTPANSLSRERHVEELLRIGALPRWEVRCVSYRDSTASGSPRAFEVHQKATSDEEKNEPPIHWPSLAAIPAQREWPEPARMG